MSDVRRRVLLQWLRRQSQPLTTTEVAATAKDLYGKLGRPRSVALTDLLALSAEGLVRCVAVAPQPVCWVAGRRS